MSSIQPTGTSRRGFLGVPLALLLMLGSALAYQNGERVAFEGQDETGRRHAAGDYRGKVVVLVFWGSRCPSSQGYAQRLERIARSYAGRDVVVLGVASNGYETAQVVAQAKRERGVSFPILLDGGGGTANAFGARVTPTAYVVDGQGTLRYQGAIDNDPTGSRGDATPYLTQAIDAVLAGRAPPEAQTAPRGCRIAP